MSVLHVYAVLHQAPRAGAVRGIEGERIKFVRIECVEVAVGELDAAPKLEEMALRAHDRAIRALCETAGTVLPARYGQEFAGKAELRAAMFPIAKDLDEQLAVVSGCEQMTLRVFGTAAAAEVRRQRSEGGGQRAEVRGQRSAAAAAAAVSGSGGGGGGGGGIGPGARYLAARAEALSLPELDSLRAELRSVVRAERVEPGAAPAPWRASVFHLVRRGVASTYLEAVARVAPSLAPVRVEPSGPWPVYAFAGAIG